MALARNAATYFTRTVLVLQATVLGLIASRSLIDPVGTAARDQIILDSGGAIAVQAVGFGAFPLCAAAFVLFCAARARSLVTGLHFTLLLTGTALVVRLAAVQAHGGLALNRAPLIGEAVFFTLALIARVWVTRSSVEPAAA
jgi:hypothetical protein